MTAVALDASAIPDPPGGAGRYVLALAHALSRRHDVDLTVVCRREDSARWPQPTAARAPALRPLRLGWEQLGLPRVVRGLGVDVHHAPHYTMPLALGLPAVVTVHDLSFFTHPEWHQRTKVAFFRSAIRTSAVRASALISVSAATSALLQELARPRAPVHVIPHGVDHARFRPDDPGDDAAARARAGVTQPYVAFVGTLEPRKDVPTLVRAFDRVAGARRDLTLVLAGGRGWGVDAVERAVAEAAHGERIRLLGYLDEDAMPALLRGAAAVAYPSLEEGFGLPVLEALACGAPVVTTSGTVRPDVPGRATSTAWPTPWRRPWRATRVAGPSGSRSPPVTAGTPRPRPTPPSTARWSGASAPSGDVGDAQAEPGAPMARPQDAGAPRPVRRGRERSQRWPWPA